MNTHLVSLDWHLGTMGFSYSDWNGVFYPAEMKPAGYLAYYSRIFNAVEIDSTFYGAPRASSVQRWDGATPPGFCFSLKAPRTITHESGLVNVSLMVREFVARVSELGDKLGVILFQFPPSFTAAALPLLEAMLAEAPQSVHYAVEVRHASWYTNPSSADEPALAAMLHRYGVAWAATQYPDLPAVIYDTAPLIYIRWIGQHGAYEHHDHERQDMSVQLQQWLALIAQQPARQVFGFFNNDYAGFAVGTANRFKQLAGLPVQPFTPPQQPRLL